MTVALFDQIASTSPGVVHEVQMLSDALNERLRAGPRASFLIEHGFSPTLAGDVLGKEMPPAGIYGAGIFFGPQSASAQPAESARPAIFVIPELLDPQVDSSVFWASARETPAALIARSFAPRLPEDLLVVSLPAPVEHGDPRPGSPIECGFRRGICGVEVAWHPSSGGRVTTDPGREDRFVMTAGHVARVIGSRVGVDGENVGEVVFTDYLASHGPLDTVADVAIIRLNRDVAFREVRGRAEYKEAAINDQVVMDSGDGPRRAWVRALIPSFALRVDKGSWGDVFMTDRMISRPGDSGSPVYLDPAGALCGHVVAGAEPSYTLVQDLSFMLGSANADLP